MDKIKDMAEEKIKAVAEPKEDLEEPKVEAKQTTVKMFLQRNTKLEKVKELREGRGGIWKVIDVLIFGFLLFSPALPIIPQMGEPLVVLVLWALIIMIMWCKIEYNHRAEVWYFCLYRGIILDFPKTNSLKGWICQKPTFFALTFLIVFGGVTYIGLAELSLDFNHGLSAIFAIAGVAFVLMLTKSFVDTEGAPQLLTLNLVIDAFEDPNMLSEKGFKVVHFTNLQALVKRKQKEDKPFSWDEVHALDYEEHKTEGISLIGGTRMFLYLNKFKDAEQ